MSAPKSPLTVPFFALLLGVTHASPSSSDPELAVLDIPAMASEAQPSNRWTSARPDGHAPIGVMGDHVHRRGEWMVSYRFMTMSMRGNRVGTDSVSAADVLADFLVTPLDMTMNMHMLGVMHAPTDNWTVMAMLPYIDQQMTHQRRNGTQFTTYSEGVGDASLTGLYRFWDDSRQSAHFNAGVSFPTGSIDEMDDGPMNVPIRLPYPMQLGSGTFDLRPGVTYLGQSDNTSWGAQGIQTFRLGENDEDYRLGNQTELTGWGAYRIDETFSTSLRLTARRWGNIHGADSQIAQSNMAGTPTVPTAIPSLRGGKQLALALGVQAYARSGILEGHRFALELSVPIYEDLNGPQLESDWSLTFGWQLAFGGAHH